MVLPMRTYRRSQGAGGETGDDPTLDTVAQHGADQPVAETEPVVKIAAEQASWDLAGQFPAVQ